MITITHKRMVIGGLVLLSGLSILYLVSTTEKDKQPVSTINPIQPINPNVKNIDAQKIILSSNLNELQIPKTLAVYTNLYQPNILTIAPVVANYFDLNFNTVVSNAWESEDKTEVLTTNTKNQSLFYRTENNLNKNGSKPTPESAMAIIHPLLSQVPVWNSFTPDQEEIIYLKFGGQELHESTSTDYDVIQIPFVQKVSGYSVFRDARTVSPLTIYVGPGNKIIKIQAHAYFVSLSATSQELPTISLEQAEKILLAGKAVLLNITSGEIITSPPTTIEEVSINQVVLEYRSSTGNDQVLPYYHFTGNTNTAFQLHYLVPAVSL